MIKVIDGEAKNLIKNYISVIPEIGCDTGITKLNKRYGNPHSILASYRKEIKLITPVNLNGTMGFRKFHSFALKCETFSKSIYWNSLETTET